MINQTSQNQKQDHAYEVGMKRSSKWPTVEKRHKLAQPFCKMCGSDKDLQVHHIEPFHLDPSKELDPNNLITLCESIGVECHFKHGHLKNWHSFNPDIVKEATADTKDIPSDFFIQHHNDKALE